MQAISQVFCTSLRGAMNGELSAVELRDSLAIAQDKVIQLTAPSGGQDGVWKPPLMDSDFWEANIFDKIKSNPWSVKTDAETILSCVGETHMNQVLLTATANQLFVKYRAEDDRLLQAAEFRRVEASTRLLHDFQAKNDAEDDLKAASHAYKEAYEQFKASRQERAVATQTEARIAAAIKRKRDQA
jgi:hypothetical protein